MSNIDPRNGTAFHTISLTVRNKPGVLVRVALIFARRGYNIESLVVSPGKTEDLSRMTITCSGDPEILEQIIHQQAKQVDVVQATDHTGQDVIDVEIALVKIKVGLHDRTALLQVAQHFQAEIVDCGQESLILRINGASTRLDACIILLHQWEIVELVRSGKIIMMRGLDPT